MTAHKPATKRKAGERVYPGPKPRLRLLKPGSECSTPELASGLPQELLSAPPRLNRKRQAGDGDDSPEAA